MVKLCSGQVRARTIALLTLVGTLPCFSVAIAAPTAPAAATPVAAEAPAAAEAEKPVASEASEATSSEATGGAVSAASVVQLSGEPNKIIEDAINLLIKELLIGSKLEKSEQAAHYRGSVENIVAPFIDFQLIAKRVMAKHYRLATDEQRQKFEGVFRDSLLEIYTKGIANYSDEEIKMLPFDGIKLSKKSKKERASVQMEIRTKEGEVFPITYQLYKNPDAEWQLENLILNGVNLGLTYRNQFNEAIKARKGNIDQVIDEWSSTAAIDEAT